MKKSKNGKYKIMSKYIEQSSMLDADRTSNQESVVEVRTETEGGLSKLNTMALRNSLI